LLRDKALASKSMKFNVDEDRFMDRAADAPPVQGLTEGGINGA
jgi:hypothetical protein